MHCSSGCYMPTMIHYNLFLSLSSLKLGLHRFCLLLFLGSNHRLPPCHCWTCTTATTMLLYCLITTTTPLLNPHMQHHHSKPLSSSQAISHTIAKCIAFRHTKHDSTASPPSSLTKTLFFYLLMQKDRIFRTTYSLCLYFLQV